MIKATLDGVKKTERWLKRKKKESEKAMNTAVKVEGYSLMKVLKKEIIAGNPGGRRFDPLSSIALRGLKRRGGGMRKGQATTALKRLQFGIEYKAKETPFRLHIGFLNRTGNKSFFKKMAAKHQTGFSRLITPRQREWVINRGAELGKIKGGETPFFLKKSTKFFRTPARPIIDPFWNSHVVQARKNIREKFRAKMAGKRI